MQTLGFKDPDWRTLIALLFVAGTCAMAVVVLPLLINRTTMNPADALYHVLCRQMEKRGMKRATHEGPRAYGMRLTAAESPLDAGRKAAVRRFVELYEMARYGRVEKHSPSATITQLKILLSETR